MSIIDSGGQGTGVPGFMGQLPAAVIGLAEQIETATGVDLFSALRPSTDGGALAVADGTSNGDARADLPVADG